MRLTLAAVTPPVPLTTRFAPSPTGRLHLGHAYAALMAWKAARQTPGGRFLVRIEDIDSTRCRQEFEAGIFEDLQWLGLSWEEPVRRQSEHLGEYAGLADTLTRRGFLYPCFCTRKDIQREIEAAGGAPQGPEGPLYPGTCRHLDPEERQRRIDSGESHALRLDLAVALSQLNDQPALAWQDEWKGPQTAHPAQLGDVVLVRKDIGTSYHLAVVWDDAVQGVNLVTRGEDLFAATHLHRLLQALLGLPCPHYAHHGLIRDSDGLRLAKRDGARSLAELRSQGWSPEQVRKAVGLVESG